MYGIDVNGREFLYDENIAPEIFIICNGEKISQAKARKIFKDNDMSLDHELKLMKSEFSTHCQIVNKDLVYSNQKDSGLPEIILTAPAKKIGDVVRVRTYGGYFDKDHQIFEMKADRETKDYTVSHWDFLSDDALKLKNYTTKNSFLAETMLNVLACTPDDPSEEYDQFKAADYSHELYKKTSDIKRFGAPEKIKRNVINAQLWRKGIIPHKVDSHRLEGNLNHNIVDNIKFDINENLFLKCENLSKNLELYFSPYKKRVSPDEIKEFEYAYRPTCEKWQVNLVNLEGHGKYTYVNVLSNTTSDNAFLAAQALIDQMHLNSSDPKALSIAEQIGSVLRHSVHEMMLREENSIDVKTIYDPQYEEALAINPKSSEFFEKIYISSLRSLDSQEKSKNNYNSYDR